MKTPDSGTIKDFFINHTEKIVFGVFVLLFLLIVWEGFTLKPMSITPQELKDSVSQGQQKLDTSKPDTSMLKSEDFVTEAENASKVISKDALALMELKQTFRHAIAQPQVKRLQPPVLSLVGLQATSGAGFCPDIRNEFSSSRTGTAKDKDKDKVKAKPGVRWVIVTALIPFEEQEKKFTDTFKKADVQYPDSDKPVYYSYYAEREEITENGSQGWKPVVLKEAFSLNKQYSSGSGAQENVEQKYLLSSAGNMGSAQDATVTPALKPYPMTMSLMNLSKHQWGADGAHLPEIPADALINMASRGIEDEEEDEINDDRSGAAPAVATNAHGEILPEKLPPYRLFRFIDTNIESGKKYRYRFKLVLKNPNFAVKPEYVADESMTKNPIIEGDWSESSPIAEVPLDMRLYCVGARVPKKEMRDNKTSLDQELGPIGRLMILKFDEAGGTEISKILSEKMVQPGNVLNMFQITNYENDSDVTKKRAVDFKTDNLVLDFGSIEKPTGFNTATPPARVLIMDKNGRILELSEIADKPAVFQKVKKPDSTLTPTDFSGHDEIIDNDAFGDRPEIGGRAGTRRTNPKAPNPRTPSPRRNGGGSTGGII